MIEFQRLLRLNHKNTDSWNQRVILESTAYKMITPYEAELAIQQISTPEVDLLVFKSYDFTNPASVQNAEYTFRLNHVELRESFPNLGIIFHPFDLARKLTRVIADYDLKVPFTRSPNDRMGQINDEGFFSFQFRKGLEKCSLLSLTYSLRGPEPSQNLWVSGKNIDDISHKNPELVLLFQKVAGMVTDTHLQARNVS